MAPSSMYSPESLSLSPPLRFVPLSVQTLARLLVVVAASTMSFNMIYLLPHLPGNSIGENHYFFSNEAHMYTGNNTTSSITVNQGRTDKNNDNKHRDEKSVSDWFREEVGSELTTEKEAELPTWKQVREVVGEAPVILGLESCQAYRDKVPPLERMLGSSGMFNTGTNLITRLLKENCEIPERQEKFGPHQPKEKYGMRWQVPWGKHTPVKFRNEHSTKKAADINKDYILPVVTIRHPYSWFGSMCKNQYTAKWDHKKIMKRKNGAEAMHLGCPRLRQGSVPTAPWNPVTVKYAEEREDHHLSLAHLWNDWYSYYIDSKGGVDVPFVVIRMEDMVFYPEETLKQVCECAGGKIRTDQKFKLIEDSAKADSRGHDISTGIYEAWIKYSKPNTKKQYGFSEADYDSARTALNGALMDSLGYQHPS